MGLSSHEEDHAKRMRLVRIEENAKKAENATVTRPLD
jgi:hypothetical protein